MLEVWHPPCVKKRVPPRFRRFWFYLSWRKATWSVLKQTSDIIWVVCNKRTTVWAPTKKLLVSWQFSGPQGITKYGIGWRKDVVNHSLEFGSSPVSCSSGFDASLASSCTTSLCRFSLCIAAVSAAWHDTLHFPVAADIFTLFVKLQATSILQPLP